MWENHIFETVAQLLVMMTEVTMVLVVRLSELHALNLSIDLSANATHYL